MGRGEDRAPDDLLAAASGIAFGKPGGRSVAAGSLLDARRGLSQSLPQAFYGGLDLYGRGRADMIAGRDRAFRSQHGKDILFDHGAELLQLGQGQFRQGLLPVDGIAHRFADRRVGVAKRHAMDDQIIGQIGGGWHNLRRRPRTAPGD